MKKFLFLFFVSMGFFLVGCGSSTDKDGIPKEELPEESSICPEEFYRFESIKRCMEIDNVD